MKKILFAVLAIIMLILGLVSCSPPKDQAQPAPETPQSSIYYNDYLGLSIEIPTAWQINMLSDNLSPQRGQTLTPDLLTYAGGGSRLELLDIQNTDDEAAAEHTRLTAYAEIFAEAVETSRYLEVFRSFITTADAQTGYILQSQEQCQLAGQTAERLSVLVSPVGQTASYIEDYYIIAIDTGFFVLYQSYWPQNETSVQDARAMRENIQIGALQLL